MRKRTQIQALLRKNGAREFMIKVCGGKMKLGGYTRSVITGSKELLTGNMELAHAFRATF